MFQKTFVQILLTALILSVSTRGQGEQDTLRVMAYNILGWSPGVNKIEDNLNESRTMIAGFQEAWSVQRNTEMAERMNWDFAFGGKDNNDYSGPYANESFWINGYHMPQLLMTGYDLLDFRYYNIFDEHERGIPDAKLWIWRGATLGKIQVSDEHSVHVMVLHLNPWEDDWCIDEIWQILGEMDSIPGPKIIMGDFNTSSHLDGNTGSQIEVHKQMQARGYLDSHYFINGNSSGRRIDFIFSSLHLRPISAQVVQPGTFGVEQGDSDHQPVYAEFVFDSVCIDEDYIEEGDSLTFAGINYDSDILQESCNPEDTTSINVKAGSGPQSEKITFVREGGQVFLQIPSRSRASLDVTNLQGENLGRFVSDNSGRATLNLEELPAGLLILRAETGAEIFSGKVLNF